MKLDTKLNLYSNAHHSLLDKVTLKKRKEMIQIIKDYIQNDIIDDVLDVGSTDDDDNESSNFIVKNLGNFKIYKSISDQKIESNFFSKSLQKSITAELTDEEINSFRSDLVISSATIEHVGSFDNQIQMCKNIINLSKKYFVISTPNRFYPLDFHTKIPFLHWLPSKIYRPILKNIGLNFFSKEENLNLLSKNNLLQIMNKLNHKNFDIKTVKLLFINSNLILIGKK